MAFQRPRFRDFQVALDTWHKSTDAAVRPLAENFLLDERLSDQREDNYAVFASSSHDVPDWLEQHKEYLERYVFARETVPETFQSANVSNCLQDIDKDQDVVRLERLSNLVRLARTEEGVEEIVGFTRRFIEDPHDAHAASVLDLVLTKYNLAADHRPVFAGFWGEVKDLLEPENPNWANAVRDRFGLGQYDPTVGGQPIPVILMRYRVAEVERSSAGKGTTNLFAIPTVLDSDMSPFFCPTPKAWSTGQTVNLTPCDVSTYSFNHEILHYHLPYSVRHVYKLGFVTEQPGMTCEIARSIHLQYLSEDLANFVRVGS